MAANAASGGNGSEESSYRAPQEAANRARPGDVVYLRGGAAFGHGNASDGLLLRLDERCCAHGEPSAPITVKSYPGEQAVIRGEFTLGGHIGIRVVRDHWRIEGLRGYQTVIAVGVGSTAGQGPAVRGVRIVGNHLSDVIATAGNFGIIAITGQPAGQAPASQIDHALDPADIHVTGNVVHTLWGEQQAGGQGTGQVLPWNLDADVEHHACFAAFKWYRNVHVRGNTFRECAAALYFKWESPGPMFMEDNAFGPTGVFGRSRAGDVQCQGNTVDVLIPTTFPVAMVCGP